jgi:hypothetical protein
VTRAGGVPYDAASHSRPGTRFLLGVVMKRRSRKLRIAIEWLACRTGTLVATATHAGRLYTVNLSDRDGYVAEARCHASGCYVRRVGFSTVADARAWLDTIAPTLAAWPQHHTVAEQIAADRAAARRLQRNDARGWK